MKRKAIALAVGALFAAPAAHAQITFGNESIGTVQLYGKLYPQFGYGKATGATQPSTTGVSTLVGGTAQTLVNITSLTSNFNSFGNSGLDIPASNNVEVGNSYIGFRGERGLGAGLKGIWQLEQSTNFDVGTGTLGNRDSFLGLASKSFGTVRLGNMDTVYKRYGDNFSMFGIASGNFVSASNMLSHIGIGNNRAARFHERQTNSIDYETPTFANVTAAVMYGPDETKGSLTSPTANNPFNKKIWSYGVKWDTERFYLSLHGEVHYDFFGGSNNIPPAPSTANNIRNGTTSSTTGAFTPDSSAHSTDRAIRGTGELRFLGQQRITLDVARLSYRESSALSGPRFESYRHTNWAIGWDAGWGGPWRTAIQYIRGGSGACTLTAGADCSTAGLASSQFNAGVRYRFDRQTFVYVIASKLTNGPSARYDNWSTQDPERGADIKQAAVGISYSF